MNLADIPEEALLVAQAVVKHLERQKWRVKVLKSPWLDARYRPSLLAEKSGLCRLVETQGALDYHKALSEYSGWLSANRHYAELYLATSAEATTQAGILAALRRDGVGLWVVNDDRTISESIAARNAALVVTPHPTLAYGDCKHDVLTAVKKFNETNRKDGLRDLCEIAERETADLARMAARKKMLLMNEAVIDGMNWSSQINTLASPKAYNPGFKPIVEDVFKTDLHSFRNARNLFDHKVKSKHEDKRRELQFAERMMQGPRLVADLVRLKRKIQ